MLALTLPGGWSWFSMQRMNHPPSPLKKFVIIGAATALIGSILGSYLIGVRFVQSDQAKAAAAAAKAPAPAASAPPPAPVAPATRTKEQGMAALMALPELQAWSARLEKSSGGKAHGALLEYDTAPRDWKGKRYWQLSFVENDADAVQRWESFLVSTSDDEILVDDADSDQPLTLERWRKEKHPERRTSAGG